MNTSDDFENFSAPS